MLTRAGYAIGVLYRPRALFCCNRNPIDEFSELSREIRISLDGDEEFADMTFVCPSVRHKHCLCLLVYIVLLAVTARCLY